MIIGLTGTIASGKSTVAKLLKEKGFEHFTYSDILRKIALERNIEQTRENLQKLGNQIKLEQGNGILSKILVESATRENIIADGIRTLDELTELKKYPNAIIIAVDAPQKERFNRLSKRNRKGDPESFDKFKTIDDHENKGLTKGQEINKCIQNADIKIENNGNFNDLKQKVKLILSKQPKF